MKELERIRNLLREIDDQLINLNDLRVRLSQALGVVEWSFNDFKVINKTTLYKTIKEMKEYFTEIDAVIGWTQRRTNDIMIILDRKDK